MYYNKWRISKTRSATASNDHPHHFLEAYGAPRLTTVLLARRNVEFRRATLLTAHKMLARTSDQVETFRLQGECRSQYSRYN